LALPHGAEEDRLALDQGYYALDPLGRRSASRTDDQIDAPTRPPRIDITFKCTAGRSGGAKFMQRGQRSGGATRGAILGGNLGAGP
jgi:hypothetical protein